MATSMQLQFELPGPVPSWLGYYLDLKTLRLSGDCATRRFLTAARALCCFEKRLLGRSLILRVFPTIKNYRTVNLRYHGRVTFIFGATYVKWSDLAYKDGCKLSDNPAFGNDRLPLALEAVVCIPEFRYCSQVPCYPLTVGERLGLDCLH